MRKKAEGMTANSDSILELLREKDAALSNKGIQINLEREGIELNYRTITLHLSRLEELGLIEIFEETGPWWVITSDGVAYLDGELDAGELVSDND